MANITGPLGIDRAKKLLRRITFHSSKERIDEFSNYTIEQASAILLGYTSKKYDIEMGGSNINIALQEYIFDPTFGGKYIDFLVTMFPAWITGSNAGSLVGWLNYLSYSVNASFKEVVRHLIREFVMANRLDLYDNVYDPSSKLPANENYSRELLELFTLGRGNYTEQDVKELARVLTGYRNTALFDNPSEWTPELGWRQINMVDSMHDSGDKQFSEFFSNTIIYGSTVEQERDDMIDMIFAHSRIGYRIVEKLIRHYLHRDPYAEGSELVEELVQIFKSTNFDMKAVITALISSEYFYQDTYTVDKFSSPLEALGLTISYLGGSISDYSKWTRRYGLLDKMGMPFLSPPEIAGHKAQHEIGYDKNWIKANTYKDRQSSLEDITDGTKLTYLLEIENFDSMINTAAKYIFAYQVDEDIIDRLKMAAFSGNDHHWGDDLLVREEAVLRIVEYVVKSSEFQLI